MQFNEESLRDHATLVNHLADLFAATNHEAARDQDYLLSWFNMRGYMQPEIDQTSHSGFALGTIASLSEEQINVRQTVALWNLLRRAGRLTAEQIDDLAIAVGQAVVAKQPPVDNTLSRTAWTVIAHSQFDLNNFAMASARGPCSFGCGGSCGSTTTSRGAHRARHFASTRTNSVDVAAPFDRARARSSG